MLGRRTIRQLMLLASGASVLVIGFACGGEAIIDPPLNGNGAGGTGGMASTSSSSAPGVGSAGLSCSTPEPDGGLFECGGTVASTGSGTIACESSLCDDAGNLWTTECSGSACRCNLNFETVCSCFVEGVDDICGTPGASCCPGPFPTL